MVSAIVSSANLEGPFETELGVLKNSDGSASWQTRNGSAVVTSVNGPIEVRIRDEVLGEATLELKILPVSGLGSPQERYMEKVVRGALIPCLLLGLHPRSLIQITCQIVSTSDKDDILETIASVINSIILACVDAGISMNSMLAASVLHQSDSSRHVACYSYPKQDLVMVESIGPFQRTQLSPVLEEIRQHCNEVFDFMKLKIEHKVEKDNRWKGMTMTT